MHPTLNFLYKELIIRELSDTSLILARTFVMHKAGGFIAAFQCGRSGVFATRFTDSHDITIGHRTDEFLYPD